MTDREMYNAVTDNFDMMQDKEEILWALERIRKYLGKPAKNIIELGSYEGGNLCMLAQLMDGGNLISVDPGGMGKVVKEDQVASLIDPNIKLCIIQDTSLSAQTLNAIYGMLFDVVWVDANHTAAAVESEEAKYGKMMQSSSVMVFHDIAFGYISQQPTCMVGDWWNKIKWFHSYEEKRTKVNSDYYGTGLLLL